MKILIISHFYEADGVMGSVRWTSFAHRLARKHEIFVVTHSSELFAPIEAQTQDNITVIKIDNECDYVKRGKQKKNGGKPVVTLTETEVSKEKNTLKSILRSSLYVYSMDSSARKNAALILHFLKENSIVPDCVISTSRPFIDAFVAYHIVKRIKKPWILDQRDLQYNDGASDFTIKLYSQMFKKMDRFVSLYTLVSHGFANSFTRDCAFNPQMCKKIAVLHNGYNSVETGIPDNVHHNKVVIAYAGDMYLGRRDADMLFAAIRMAIDDNEDLMPNDFLITYAGTEGMVLEHQASQYDLSSIVEDNGKVPHSRAIELQREADCLLLLTWNTEMDRGVLPGKFYEYMAADKPIICITCGSVPDGEAESMMNDMNLGIAVNQLNRDEGVKTLSRYLTDQYKRKINCGEVLFNPDVEKVTQFDYDNLYLKLEGLIGGITH